MWMGGKGTQQVQGGQGPQEDVWCTQDQAGDNISS